MVRTENSRSRIFCAAAALLLLGGCFVIQERFQSDEPLSDGYIRSIRRGVTTRQDVIERLGPPTAVARKDTTMVYPPTGLGKQGRTDIQSDAFFELFSESARAGSAVYYYDSSRIKGAGFIPLIGGGGYSSRVVLDRLWLLVDESTGVVEDYVFRQGD